MNRTTVIFLIASSMSTSVYAACTHIVEIEKLWPREGGWVHIQAKGVSDIDISNCGQNNYWGMLLNFNDKHGTSDGKKMLLSSLLASFTSGKKLKLCSNGCDSQFPKYSRLSHIDHM